jgi:hypothetical protein
MRSISRKRTIVSGRMALLFVSGMLGFAPAVRQARATDVSGTLATSTWTESGGPYRVTGDLTVPDSATLTVEPGVLITLNAGVGITVHGALIAVGTSDKGIRIDATDPAQPWAGILLTGATASGRLEYLDVAHASKAKGGATSFAGGISNEGRSKIHIQNCRFHDFKAPCVENNTLGELTILDTLIEDTMEAIHSNTSFADIERCHIRNIHGYSDCVDFDNDSTPHSIIKDCLLENGEDDGLDLSSSNCIVSNITIHHMACKGLSIDGFNGASSPHMSWIGITDCLDGVVSKDSCDPVLSHITVSRCDFGVKFYEKDLGKGGGKGTLDSFIVWGNKTSVNLDALSTISITFSDIEGGYTGTGNMKVDPLFVDAVANDFRLKPGSPALGAGKNGEEMGAYPAAPSAISFVRADSNLDGTVDISDAVAILFYLFAGGVVTPGCLDALDVDDTGVLEVTDAIFLLGALFVGNTAIPMPFPQCGIDPTTEDGLGCGGGCPGA